MTEATIKEILAGEVEFEFINEPGIVGFRATPKSGVELPEGLLTSVRMLYYNTHLGLFPLDALEVEGVVDGSETTVDYSEKTDAWEKYQVEFAIKTSAGSPERIMLHEIPGVSTPGVFTAFVATNGMLVIEAYG